jgi:alkanesulfonate monooxygenase SsuD/methylene tetrahydromethanopterin reductase-like flavin-dependent oxidoreductase (luciferase family)
VARAWETESSIGGYTGEARLRSFDIPEVIPRMPQPVQKSHSGSASGIAIGTTGQVTLADVLARAQLAEKIGLDSVWFTQLPAMHDNLSLLAAIAMLTERVRLGAGIVPYYAQPPAALAQTALTIDELSGGRAELGIGSGHKLTAEVGLGVPLGPPIASLREYLTIVRSIIRDGEAQFDGEHYRTHAHYAPPRRPDMPTHLGALGPQMCRLAGEQADGLLLWLCPFEYVELVVLPNLAEGLRRANRDRSECPLIVFVPAAVSDDPEADVEQLRNYLLTYTRVPNYRRMYEAAGLGAAMQGRTVGDELVHSVGVIGKAEEIAERVAAFRAAGADEVVIAPTATAYSDPELWRQTAEAILL